MPAAGLALIQLWISLWMFSDHPFTFPTYAGKNQQSSCNHFAVIIDAATLSSRSDMSNSTLTGPIRPMMCLDLARKQTRRRR